MDSLAHTQALLLYHIIRLFDGNISARASGERTIPILETSAIGLLAHVIFDTEGNCSDRFSECCLATLSDLWKDWIFQESARRTLLFTFFFLQAYRVLTGSQNLYQCDGRLGLCHSWMVSEHLWQAETALDFRNAWRQRNHFLIIDGQFTVMLSEAKAGDVDLFGKMLLSAAVGIPELEAWFASRGVSLSPTLKAVTRPASAISRAPLLADHAAAEPSQSILILFRLLFPSTQTKKKSTNDKSTGHNLAILPTTLAVRTRRHAAKLTSSSQQRLQAMLTTARQIRSVNEHPSPCASTTNGSFLNAVSPATESPAIPFLETPEYLEETVFLDHGPNDSTTQSDLDHALLSMANAQEQFLPHPWLDDICNNEYYLVGVFVDFITSSRRPQRSWVFELPNIMATTTSPSVKFSIRAAALVYYAVASNNNVTAVDALHWYLAALESYHMSLHDSCHKRLWDKKARGNNPNALLSSSSADENARRHS
ncbi:uncharacterized protein Triagg1_9706 [Trichoderma aggressivum f. europaeum]|uniref:Uncharacterized protein n=1 Tax=Trichoderma aggressivum f. europaeum TaxID=173218 RepID=A0AAE1I6L8_9HYPO|nr:hypothetical protein Triagg1_9706 [Trichoderma aggressivum f. europaeum]